MSLHYQLDWDKLEEMMDEAKKRFKELDKKQNHNTDKIEVKKCILEQKIEYMK